MWPRFGIKIGNNTLCIANIKSSSAIPSVVANKQGNRVSPACLLWDGKDEIECGLTAEQKMATRPHQAIINSLQFLNLVANQPDDVNTAIKTIPCSYDVKRNVFQLKSKQIIGSEEKEIIKEMSPFDVQRKLLECELELAKQSYNDIDSKPIVVLSIPSYYSTEARTILTKAAEEAGFHVAQVIDESSAAILAYGIGESSNNDSTSNYILTIKCGGLYSHFALYEVKHGFYSKLDTSPPFLIGGQQITEELVKFICKEFQHKYKLDPNESRRSMAKIRTAAVTCKHVLTSLPTTQIYIDSLMDGVDFNIQMSRARFESLIQPVINNIMQILGDYIVTALKNQPQIENIDTVVLLGATTQIPRLQVCLAAKFPNATIHNTIAADEVVAIGCTRQTLFLEEPQQHQILETSEDCDCIEEELYIWHSDNTDELYAQKLFSPGDVLPKTTLVNVKLNENDMKSEIFQLRAGSNIMQVPIKMNATSTVPETGESFVRLRAEIIKSPNDTSPVVRLKCI